MAPRRNALIFSLRPEGQAQQDAAATSLDVTGSEVTGSEAAGNIAPPPVPIANGNNHARYYSVHRQYGRQPDATPMPAPAYLDALPVDVSGMASGSDLAEPPLPPTLIRNNQGRLQALPNLDEPSA